MDDQPTQPGDRQPIPAAVALVQKLFLKHQPAIRGFLMAMQPDVHLVDDLMHTVFLCVSEKAESFDAERNFVAWARGIAKIELLRHRRASAQAPQSFAPEVIEQLSQSAPDREFVEQRIEAMTTCMDELSPRAREAIDLRYQQDLAPPEIASRMSVALSSINVTLSRARAALRKCVQQKLKRQEED